MNDLELLELAAKAAGINHVNYDGVDYDGSAGLVIVGEHGRHLHGWNPLLDDGDAFRLMVLLSLRVEPYTGVKMGNDNLSAVANITDVYNLHSGKIGLSEKHNMDPAAATRRAIVRAAAEIGRSMP